MLGRADLQSLSATFDAIFDRTTNRLRSRTRRLHKTVAALGRRGRLSDADARLLQLRIYDFEMERGIARSGMGIRKLRNLRAASSFKRSLYQQFRRESMRPSPGRMVVQNKVAARQLMKRLGVRTPESTEAMPLGDALECCRNDPPFEHMVLKPTSSGGSKGVFLIDDDGIFGVKRKERLRGFGELEESARGMLAEGRIAENEWIVEERIPSHRGYDDPPREYKFLCFYGRPGLAFEIEWRGTRRVCCWTSEGDRVPVMGGYRTHSGSDPRVDDQRFLARLSTRIPVPYARFDFFDSPEGMVFSEMSVGLGNFDRLVRGLDQHLGELYLEAESRLYDDMLRGKRFPEFMDALERLPAFEASESSAGSPGILGAAREEDAS